MNVGIIGSRKYENKKKIKDFIFKLKTEYGDDVTIISGGCYNGADSYAKRYAIEFGLRYEEYPPAHRVYNTYCVLDPDYYGKSYNVLNYFNRNKQIAQNSDVVVGFIPDGEESNGTNNALEWAIQFNKKTLIIN